MAFQKEERGGNVPRTEEYEASTNKSLKVMYSNSDGILCKILEVRDILQQCKAHLLWLAETKLKDSKKNRNGNI